MCGIVGYVGPKSVIDVLMPGLARLEYRGYDSAGVALNHGGSLTVLKQAGRIADLQGLVDREDLAEAHTGIGHTRWATHGAPNTGNAHPHLDCNRDVVVVHNGIIENWVDLKGKLIETGHEFESDTDTEVVAHMIEEMADLPLADAVRSVMNQADGALALVVMRKSEPDVLVGARRGSPLVVGRGKGENFLASDIPAFLEHTRHMVIVEDDRVVEIRPDEVILTDLGGNSMPLDERLVEWDFEAAEKGGFDTFMLKEIFEQPHAITDTLAGRVEFPGRVVLDELTIDPEILREIDKVFVVACGTSYHAAMMAKYAIERWARLPVEIDIASEFRYRDPVLDDRSLVIGISQSGETIDTLAAVRYARAQGSVVIGVSNVVESALARESDAVLYTRAGPEIGVAATKTFTTQLVAMQLLGLYLAQVRGALDPGAIELQVKELLRLPDQVEAVLARCRGAEDDGGALVRDPGLVLPGPVRRFPGRDGGRPEAQGDCLRPGRGIRGGGNEARPDRTHRTGGRCGRRGHGQPRPGQDPLQHGGDEGAGRDHRSRRRRGRRRRSCCRPCDPGAGRA